jgi:hypothetical protein
MADYRHIQDRLSRIFEKRIVFIVGATRWGTAWLQQALDDHPEICCRGEGHFTDVLFPMLLKVLDRYNSQTEIFDKRLKAAGLPGNQSGFTFDDVNYLLATAIGLVFGRWAADDRIKCVGEKTPEHVLALDLLTRVVPGAKVVHVVRDGRDEATSAWQFNMRVSTGEFPKRFPRFADFSDFFAKNWSKSVGIARRFGRAHRDAYFQLRCEQLPAEGQAILKRLCRFLDVDDNAERVAACARAAWRKVPLDVKEGSWRKQFDDEALRAFRRQAGELLKLLGYEA